MQTHEHLLFKMVKILVFKWPLVPLLSWLMGQSAEYFLCSCYNPCWTGLWIQHGCHWNLRGHSTCLSLVLYLPSCLVSCCVRKMLLVLWRCYFFYRFYFPCTFLTICTCYLFIYLFIYSCIYLFIYSTVFLCDMSFCLEISVSLLRKLKCLSTVSVVLTVDVVCVCGRKYFWNSVYYVCVVSWEMIFTYLHTGHTDTHFTFRLIYI